MRNGTVPIEMYPSLSTNTGPGDNSDDFFTLPNGSASLNSNSQEDGQHSLPAVGNGHGLLYRSDTPESDSVAVNRPARHEENSLLPVENGVVHTDRNPAWHLETNVSRWIDHTGEDSRSMPSVGDRHFNWRAILTSSFRRNYPAEDILRSMQDVMFPEDRLDPRLERMARLREEEIFTKSRSMVQSST